jgi:hypothetical protein
MLQMMWKKYFESNIMEEVLTLNYFCVIYVQRVSKPTKHLSGNIRYRDFFLLATKHSPIALPLH